MTDIELDPLVVAYRKAYKFLSDKVGEDTLKKELQYYLGNKPDSLEAVYKRMLGSLKNKAGWQNYIGQVDDMRLVFKKFDPHYVIKRYGSDVDKLFLDLKAIFGDRYKFDINNKRNAWKLYSKGALSAAGFLSSFKSFKDFDTFVNSFTFNEYAVAALPMLLEKEVFGFGFPLACDFLKEIGYANYGKPDVHLRDIFVGLNLVSNDSDYEIFKAIVRTALLVNTQPAIVDKVYWIIGSGKLETSGNEYIGRSKKQFVEYAS